jgi:formate dehydrogenase assembly factor FdhD
MSPGTQPREDTMTMQSDARDQDEREAPTRRDRPAQSRRQPRSRTAEEAYRQAEATAALASAIAVTLEIAGGPISNRMRAALPDLDLAHGLALTESALFYAEARRLEDMASPSG